MSAEIRIGTSGWHYKHWVGAFYPPRWPASKMLGFYQLRFDTVEINNSFYRLPPEKALNGWRLSTPPGFCFAVKGSRFLTHMKKLKDPGPGIDKFFSRADLLEEKLGPVLFQLPPNWEVNLGRLENFLDALPKWHRYAFEFRNATWNTPEVLQLLRQRNVAYCPFHLAGYQSPVEITADITYIRLHGPGGKYQGSYDDEALRVWAQRIKDWRRELKAIYFYFDNDDSGYAAYNALRLRELIAS
ncbi:MAG: DUF72 domain-containing protein [Acidobacteriota bacterium]|nr:DUF72 domain-containing protein [Acidobacteriota bacterium]